MGGPGGTGIRAGSGGQLAAASLVSRAPGKEGSGSPRFPLWSLTCRARRSEPPATFHSLRDRPVPRCPYKRLTLPPVPQVLPYVARPGLGWLLGRAFKAKGGPRCKPALRLSVVISVKEPRLLVGFRRELQPCSQPLLGACSLQSAPRRTVPPDGLKEDGRAAFLSETVIWGALCLHGAVRPGSKCSD